MLALIAEAVATVGSIVGILLINHRRRSGFLWWVVADVLWVPILASRELWGAAGLFAFYTVLAVHGWVKWGKEVSR